MFCFKGKVHENPIGIFWFVLFTCLILPITFFLGKFSGKTISENISDWGNFGDYIGGFIGTIIAIANLYIFVRLTIMASEIQKSLSERELHHQREAQNRDFRNQTILNLTNILDTLLESIHSLKREMNVSHSKLGRKGKQGLQCSDIIGVKSNFKGVCKNILRKIKKEGASPNRDFVHEMLGEVLFAKLKFESACESNEDLFGKLNNQMLTDSLTSMVMTLNIKSHEQFSNKAFQMAFDNFIKQKDIFLKELRKDVNERFLS